MNKTLNTPSKNQYEGIDVFLSSKEYLKYCIFKSILQGIVMLIGFIAGIVLMAIIINNAEELIKSLENFLINNNFNYTLEFDSSSSEISFTSDSSLFTIGSIACMWFLYSFAKPPVDVSLYSVFKSNPVSYIVFTITSTRWVS